MAFGKRVAGDPPPAPPKIASTAPSDDSLMSAPGVGAMRTVVANPGEIDRKFIALAAGVVVLAAGAALAAEAFPDADGQAFMTSLAANFPREHSRLLDTLADTAMAGGDRDDLYSSLNAWSFNFVPAQMSAIGRTGARGFDAGVAILDDVLVVVEKEVGGCTGAKLQQLVQQSSGPAFFERLTRFDGPAYHTGMRANRAFVDLAAAGRTMPAISTTLTANDTNIVQSTFFSMMSDPQVMSLIQAAGAAQAGGYNAQSRVLNDVNFCQLGRTILLKLKSLPDGTKGRLFGTLMSQDISRFSGPGAFSGPNGGPSFNMMLSN